MTRNMARRIGVLTTLCSLLLASIASAQVIESNWIASLTGAQQWQVNSNWSTGTFPNDPGRVDPDQTVITPVIGANLSVALGADLSLNVGATDVTVASLRIGGTAGPVTTTITGSGGRLVFENYELNNASNPNAVIPSFNNSNALLVSGGVAGSVNRITAPIFLNNETLDIDAASTTDLTITGPITYSTNGSIRNLSPTARVVIESNLNVLADQLFRINNSPSAAGVVEVRGVISGTPTPGLTNPQVIEIGSDSPTAKVGTVILSAANTTTMRFELERGDIVLANNQSLGLGVVKPGQQTNLGINLISTDDSRTISNEMSLAQYVTIKGSHSLTWAGNVSQGNSRGWVNLLPEGKTFTLSGNIGADSDAPASPQNNRIMYFDGTGETVISGSLRNRIDTLDEPQSFGVRGTGVVRVTGTANTYTGYTFVGGGNLHFASNASLPPALFRSTAGAVGVDTGTFYIGGSQAAPNSAFLTKFNNRANAEIGTTVFDDGDGTPDYENFRDFDNGALMLTAAEAAVNLNFSAGDLLGAASMSVAAPEGGLTYTGIVTPAPNSATLTGSDYRFGGGSGVLTLPGTNQLTGANGLRVINGQDSGDQQGLGAVRITGTNNYTGVTRVQGKYLSSQSTSAQANNGPLSPDAVYNGSTLIATQLANGGAPSSIGSSSSAASNLVLQGGTLRYEGAATSTDRLFTIGTHGATLDSSGSGAVQFTNSAALSIGTASDRQGQLGAFDFQQVTGSTPSSRTVAFDLHTDTDDLVVGMQVTDTSNFFQESTSDNDSVITVTAVQSPTRFVFSDPLGFVFGGNTTFRFIDTPRDFTLTGNNAGNNLLRPIIANSPTNVVNVVKEGSGKWILDGVNTYTGTTTVDDGVLSITHAYLADNANVSIASGAVLDLNFVGSDTVNRLLLNGVSQPIGSYGAIGSGAQFQSSYFTGTGLLNVTSVALSGVAGDYNNDGVVNAADYTVWRDRLGAAGGLPNDPIGGVVGQGQYSQWASNYGAPSSALAVPEPLAASLLVVGWIGGARRRRRV